ncbi:Chitinase 4 [Entomophthora muscae]|uniref:Chitinase 4 n=1 Tax=Entomophthora muscae TaxID=34485 RepID=A0ACC2SFS7_9FUNG|nr:Chitinase 4 [Entomophthora muscae]
MKYGLLTLTFHFIFGSVNAAWRSAYFTRERSSIPLAKIPRDHIANLTHLTYSFAHLDTSLNCAVLPHEITDSDGRILAGDLLTLFQFKKDYRNLKTGVSISGLFGDVALSKRGFEKFIDSVANLVINYGLDYIDIDWEFPVIGEDSENGAKGSSADKNTFIVLAKALHERFQNFPGPLKPKLSIALPCPWNYIKNYDIGNLHVYLDMIHLMAYDFNTPAGKMAYHQANLYSDHNIPATSIQNTTDYLSSVGVPLNKVVLGIPAYAYTFRNLGTDKGLGAPINQPGYEEQKNSNSDYASQALLRTIPSIYQDMHMKWDSATQSSYLYNPDAQSLTTLETKRSVKAKTDFIIKNGLGGAFLWSLAWEDTHPFSTGLLSKINEDLGGLGSDEENNLDFPNSKFKNVRSDAILTIPALPAYALIFLFLL